MSGVSDMDVPECRRWMMDEVVLRGSSKEDGCVWLCSVLMWTRAKGFDKCVTAAVVVVVGGVTAAVVPFDVGAPARSLLGSTLGGGCGISTESPFFVKRGFPQDLPRTRTHTQCKRHRPRPRPLRRPRLFTPDGHDAPLCASPLILSTRPTCRSSPITHHLPGTRVGGGPFSPTCGIFVALPNAPLCVRSTGMCVTLPGFSLSLPSASTRVMQR